jgi:hypothetical protein
MLRKFTLIEMLCWQLNFAFIYNCKPIYYIKYRKSLTFLSKIYNIVIIKKLILTI